MTRVVMDAKKSGWLDDVKTDKYQAGRTNNLKAIHKALMQAQESDGQFPPADHWMEVALIRLKTSDITENEAKDKLRRPGGNPSDFGYAINSTFAGKSMDQVRVAKSAILVFESLSVGFNASGSPEKDGLKSGKGITFEGEVVDLPTNSKS